LAITGSAVEMTVESSISMNSAQPTIIGARNSSGEILNSLGLIAADYTSAPITICKSPHPVNGSLAAPRGSSLEELP
jgi:hypothetical protein